jgi:hypothetical protein
MTTSNIEFFRKNIQMTNSKNLKLYSKTQHERKCKILQMRDEKNKIHVHLYLHKIENRQTGQL